MQNNGMRKIRIAHIGCNKNSHAPQIFTSLKEQSELFEIVGYTLPEDEGVTGGAQDGLMFLLASHQYSGILRYCGGRSLCVQASSAGAPPGPNLYVRCHL